MVKAWNKAAETVLKKYGGSSVAEVTKGLSQQEARKLVNGKIFNDVRKQFWANVNDVKSTEAKRFFTENGFAFKGRATNAPLHESHLSQGSRFVDEYRISVDHLAPKAKGDNWKIALDPGNLQFTSHAENRFLNTMDVKGIRR